MKCSLTKCKMYWMRYQIVVSSTTEWFVFVDCHLVLLEKGVGGNNTFGVQPQFELGSLHSLLSFPFDVHGSFFMFVNFLEAILLIKLFNLVLDWNCSIYSILSNSITSKVQRFIFDRVYQKICNVTIRIGKQNVNKVVYPIPSSENVLFLVL